jgi:hypothetical protein
MKGEGDPDSEVGFRIIQLPLDQISQYPKMPYFGSIILSSTSSVLFCFSFFFLLSFNVMFWKPICQGIRMTSPWSRQRKNSEHTHMEFLTKQDFFLSQSKNLMQQKQMQSKSIASQMLRVGA